MMGSVRSPQPSSFSVSRIGFEVGPGDHRERLTEDLSKIHACHPVFLTNEIVDLYYNGFSNR